MSRLLLVLCIALLSGASLGVLPVGQAQGGGLVYPFQAAPPACAGAGEARGQLVYARTADAPDRYAERAPKLRAYLAQANGLVHEEGLRHRVAVDLAFACDGDNVSVLHVVVAGTAASVGYNTYEAALRGQGLSDPLTKYLVWFELNATDCGHPPCWGTAGNPPADDRPGPENRYNQGDMHAALFGLWDDNLTPMGLLHEYLHAMGGVQHSAPHATGDHHCRDEPPADRGGNDILCRSDDPATRFLDACSGWRIRVDCNNDDYFHPGQPPAGSYLASHWNLGSRVNRFVRFGEAPAATPSSPPAGPSSPAASPSDPYGSGLADVGARIANLSQQVGFLEHENGQLRAQVARLKEDKARLEEQRKAGPGSEALALAGLLGAALLARRRA